MLVDPEEDKVLDCIPLVEVDNVDMVSVESWNTLMNGRIQTRSIKPSSGAARTAAQAARARGGDRSPRSAARESPTIEVGTDGKPAASSSKQATRAAFENANSSEEEERDKAVFNIVTTAGGYNGGRIFSLRTKNAQECQEWVAALSAAVHNARHEAEMAALGGRLARWRAMSR